MVVVSNAWAGPGERRRGGEGPGEGEVEKERWRRGDRQGSMAVPGKPSMGGAAVDNLFLLHLRNIYQERGNPEQDTECWDSWQRAPLEQAVPQGLESFSCSDSSAAVPPAPAGRRCSRLSDHMGLVCPWMGTQNPEEIWQVGRSSSECQDSGIHVLTSSGAPLPGKKLPSS